MPSLRSDRLGGGSVVARQHDDLQSLLVQRPDRFGRGVLDRIRDADQAGGPAVDRDEHDRLALAAKRRRLAHPARAGSIASVLQQRAVAERDRPATDRASHALAGCRLEVGRRLQSELRSPRRRRRSPPPADARSPARGSRRARATSSSPKPGAATTPVRRGLPSVSVPVLSTTSVSTFSIVSSASAFLISTPASRRARCRP